MGNLHFLLKAGHSVWPHPPIEDPAAVTSELLHGDPAPFPGPSCLSASDLAPVPHSRAFSDSQTRFSFSPLASRSSHNCAAHLPNATARR